jgi:hypothetical protein
VEAQSVKMLAGHHGEITIDPATGAILRLYIEADLEPNLPMTRASTLVEYGTVDIGGKPYICPLKSISISRSRTVKILPDCQANSEPSAPSRPP